MRFNSLQSLQTLGFACLLISAAPTANPQVRHTNAKTTSVMSNNDVIALSSAGLGDDVVIAKIHATHSVNFDTSVQGLSALKAGGVSSTVIRYMIDPTAPVAAPVPASVAPAAAAAASVAAAAVAAGADDPESAHPSGIYMLATGSDGKLHLAKLDRITARQQKSGGSLLSSSSYGITKSQTKAVIDGDQAMVHTRDVAPTFYVYMPDSTNSGSYPVSIDGISLVKLDAKGSTREVVVGSENNWNGASSILDKTKLGLGRLSLRGGNTDAADKTKHGFKSEMLKTGIYKLTVSQPLPVGQYAFQQQNFTTFFGFGVTSSE